MKLYRADEFLKLPKGILCAKFDDSVTFLDLMIKGESILHNDEFTDFYYQDVYTKIKESSTEELDHILDVSLKEIKMKGSSTVEMDFNCESRDGFYDKDQLYAVYDDSEIKSIIGLLTSTLGKINHSTK